MAIKNKAALTTENNNSISGQTNPESISPVTLGSGIIQDIIDSMYNRSDDALTPSPRSLSVAQLNTEITNGTLFDKQWITITGRGDSNPLIVQCQGNNLISPFGWWIKGGKPLSVVMDYVDGYEGQTNPFIAVFDENRLLNLPNQIVIADASKGAGKELVCVDSTGLAKWMAKASSQTAILNPAAMTGSTALMMGLAGAITPTKSGNVLVQISGNYTSSDHIGVTTLSLRIGTTSAPVNGDAATGTVKQTKTPIAHSTDQGAFSFNCLMTLTVGTAYWIDMSCKNTANGAVQLFDVSLTAIEQ